MHLKKKKKASAKCINVSLNPAVGYIVANIIIAEHRRG